MIKKLICFTNKVTSFLVATSKLAKSIVALCAVGVVATVALTSKLTEIEDTEQASEEDDELPNNKGITV